MSGPKCASYEVHVDTRAALDAAREAARARAQEQARLDNARARWGSARRSVQRLGQRAAYLRAQGVDCPAVGEPSEEPGATADDVERVTTTLSARAAKLEPKIAELEQVLREMKAQQAARSVIGRAGQRRDRPADRVVDTGSSARDLAKCTEILGRLVAGADRPPELDAIADRLTGAGAQERASLLLDLRSAVTRLNEETRAREERVLVEADARQVLADTGDEDLRAALASGAGTGELRTRTARAAERDNARRHREYVRQVVLDSLGACGYDVADGFAVESPDQGVLVRSNAGSATHGVQVRVSDGQVNVEAVRFGVPDGSGRIPGDTDAEVRLCEDVPKVWETMRRRGIGVDVSAQPVGLVVPRSVPAPATPRRRSARAAQPRERQAP